MGAAADDGAGCRAGHGADAGRVRRVQAVGQRLLQGGSGGRLPVVHVGGRRWRGAGGRLAGIRPGADVRRTAVQALEGGIVAGLGEQLEADGRLAFPFGSERVREEGFQITLQYKRIS